MKQLLLHLYYKALARLARRYILKRQPFVIGINGSVGKTSARMIIAEVLQLHLGDKINIYTSPQNFNGELGLPLSIFKIESWTPGVKHMWKTYRDMKQLLTSNTKPYDVLILEYGTDHPGEMDLLLSIVKPQLSVVTKFDAVHSLQYGSEQAIAQEELKMQQTTTLYNYINTDDQYALELSKYLNTKTYFYSTTSSSSQETNKDNNPSPVDISISNYHLKTNTSGIQASSTLNFSTQQLSITTNLLGEINHSYIALSYDILDKVRQQFDIPQFEFNTDLTLQLQPGRFSIFEGIYDSILIDSTYNASPSSMRAVISESIQLQKKLFPDSHRVFILGEMRELGDLEQSEHEALADRLLDEVLQPDDTVILLGEAMTYTYTIINNGKLKIRNGQKKKNKENKRTTTKAIQTIENQTIVENGTTQPEVGELKLENGINSPSTFGLRHYISFQDVSSKTQELLSQWSHNNQSAFILLKGSQNTIFLEEVVKSLLKHSSDAQYLTRQSEFWLSKKQ